METTLAIIKPDAYKKGYISKAKLKKISKKYKNNQYGEYLLRLINNEI